MNVLHIYTCPFFFSTDPAPDALSFYARLQYVPFLPDRFGFLNEFSPYRIAGNDPLPDAANAPPFEDICAAVASDIARRAEREDKDIYLAWSGGVDSTCAAVSLLNIAKKRLRLLANQASVDEYPMFFENVRREGVAVRFVENFRLRDIYSEIAHEHLLVFGWCGDQLYGSDLNLFFPDWFRRPWKDFVSALDGGHLVPQFEAGLEKTGLPIRTTAEFFWWMNFACKWVYVANEFALHHGHGHNVINFFEDRRLQDWSMARFDRTGAHHPSETEHYKPEMKDVIHEYTHDNDYRRAKGKIGSWGSAINDGWRMTSAIKDDEGIRIIRAPFPCHGLRLSSVMNRYMRKELEPYRREA